MRDGTWRRFTGSAGIAGTTSRIALANAETAAASTFTAIRTPGPEPRNGSSFRRSTLEKKNGPLAKDGPFLAES